MKVMVEVNEFVSVSVEFGKGSSVEGVCGF